jgi:uncharacterized membrane protein HdeD (DUF308 family)
MGMISEVRSVVRYWWLFLLLGVLVLFFGLLVFALPGDGYGNLTPYFVIAFLMNGLFEGGFALSNRGLVQGWAWHLAGGAFDLLAAGVLYFTPVLAAVSLPLFAGCWLLLRSASIVGRCFDLPVIWPEKIWMAMLGFAGLAFSFLVLYNAPPPGSGLFLWTSCALLSIGLFYIFLGIHLRGWKDGVRPGHGG